MSRKSPNAFASGKAALVLPGGRPLAPGEHAFVDFDDPEVAGMLDAGTLTRLESDTGSGKGRTASTKEKA